VRVKNVLSPWKDLECGSRVNEAWLPPPQRSPAHEAKGTEIY
jgi:hypothetical protein